MVRLRSSVSGAHLNQNRLACVSPAPGKGAKKRNERGHPSLFCIHGFSKECSRRRTGFSLMDGMAMSFEGTKQPRANGSIPMDEPLLTRACPLVPVLSWAIHAMAGR